MCVSRLFSSGPNKCPECQITLRKSNYTSQTFEDVSVERECRIRKLIYSQIGKALDDFSDEEDYNEYLERVEEIVEELMEIKKPRETAERMQQIKESMNALFSSSTAEPVKRRKIEEPPEIVNLATVSQINYFFPPDAIDRSTIPDQVFQGISAKKRGQYKDLIEVMIKKASMSLVYSDM